MNNLDVATASAVAALAIAVVALVVASAQALQQYFITGQLIRLCDSVVFGDLPGHGHRVWQLSQFRFRVVYEMPQIGLPPELWPSSTTISLARNDGSLRDVMKLERKPTLSAPAIRGNESQRASRPSSIWSASPVAKRVEGEASWSLFCRAVYPSCRESILLSFMHGDADRCPAELPTVPMPASLRDIVVMALMAGMECTAASFERGSVSMQGVAGTITSAQHPILGPLIHFSPRNMDVRCAVGSHGVVTKEWLWRVMDNCIVAGSHYNGRGRRAVEMDIGKFSRSYRKSGPHGGKDLVRVQNKRQRPSERRGSFERRRPPKVRPGGRATSLERRRPEDWRPRRGSDSELSDTGYSQPRRESPQRPMAGTDGPWTLVPMNPSSPARNMYTPLTSHEPPRPDFTTFRASEELRNIKALERDARVRSEILRRKEERRLADMKLREARRQRDAYRTNYPETFSDSGTETSENVGVVVTGQGMFVHHVETASLDVFGVAYTVREGYAFVDDELPMDLVDKLQEHTRKLRTKRRKNQDRRKRDNTTQRKHESKSRRRTPNQSRRTEKFQTMGSRERVRVAPQADEGSMDWSTSSNSEISISDFGSRSEVNNNGEVTGDNGTEDTGRGQPETSQPDDKLEEQAPHGDGTNTDEQSMALVLRSKPPSPPGPERRQGFVLRRNEQERQRFLAERRRGRQTESSRIEIGRSHYERTGSHLERMHHGSDGSLDQRKRLRGPSPVGTERSSSRGSHYRIRTFREVPERDNHRYARQDDRRAREEELFQRRVGRNRLSPQLGSINWFWLSQTDILPGFWATPWRSFEALNHQICVGAINVIIEAISAVTGGAGLLVSEYPPPPSSPMSGNLSGTVDWLHAGKSTYPAYAYNSRGGVVCGGVFSSVTLQQPFFANPIPAIELLFPASPMGQSQPAFQKSQYDVERRLIELMRLDAWLSIVGRSRAIRDGPSALLIQAPAVVRSLMDAFELDFLDADTSSLDGGAQINRAVAASVVDNLERNTLVGAEVLYALVATLRAVKVGECVLTGPDTAMLAEILEKDVQVSLV